MTIQHRVPEDSLAIAMIELDRLERERRDFEDHRRELRATARRQAKDILELGHALRANWPRAIARQRRRASAEHELARARERRLVQQVEREHADRLAELTSSNAERRAALARLEREVVAEFHPARAALVWLTPFAAAGLIAALGFMVVQQQAPATDLTQPPEAPLSAVADPVSNERSDDDAPVILSDSDASSTEEGTNELVVEPALTPPALTPSKPSKKANSSKKPTPVTAPVTKPVTKPHSKPIVLHDGDDPLGDL